MTHIGSSHITRQLVRCTATQATKKPRGATAARCLVPVVVVYLVRGETCVTHRDTEYSTTHRYVCQTDAADFQILAVSFLEPVTQDLRSVRDDYYYTPRSEIVKQLGIFCQLVAAGRPAEATKNRGMLEHHSTRGLLVWVYRRSDETRSSFFTTNRIIARI